MLTNGSNGVKIPLSYLKGMVDDLSFMGMMEVFVTLKAFGSPILTYKEAVAVLRGAKVSRYKIKKYLPKLIAAKFIGQSKSATKKRTLFLRGQEWMIEQQADSAWAKFVTIPNDALGRGAEVFKAHICNLAVKMLATRIDYATSKRNRKRAMHVETGTNAGAEQSASCRAQDRQVTFSIEHVRSAAPNKSRMTLSRIRKRAVAFPGSGLDIIRQYKDLPKEVKDLTVVHVRGKFNWKQTKEIATQMFHYEGLSTEDVNRLCWNKDRVRIEVAPALKFEPLTAHTRKAAKTSALWKKPKAHRRGMDERRIVWVR